MRNYRDYKGMMMDCFRKNRVKLTVLVILLQLLNASISYMDIANHMDGFSILLYILLFGLVLIVNFTLLFFFLSTLRGSGSLLEEAKYSLKRFWTELGFTVFMGICSTLVMMVLGTICLAIPVLCVFLTFVVSIFVIILQCMFAFAIHDGGKGIFDIIGLSMKLLKRNWKPLVRAVIPYVVFNLIVLLLIHFLIQNTFKDVTTIQQAVTQAFAKSNYTFAYELLGLYLLNYLGSALLLTYVYMFYAQVYEAESDLFTMQSPIEGTIIIDATKATNKEFDKN